MIDDLIISKIYKLMEETDIFINEPMKNHTSFKVGGPVDVLLTPHTEKQIKELILLFNANNTPFYIMGNGSNLLVSDEGFCGAVIKIVDNLNHYSVQDQVIHAQAGLLLSRLSKVALSAHLTGLEFASGIPGTIGGAVTMNAGAYSGEMKDILISATVIDREGNIFDIINGNLKLGYRTSAIQKNNLIVLSSKVKLQTGEYQHIKDKMMDYDYRRTSKQPLEWPSAGSTFKRPTGYYAGKLIEDSGLKGHQLGGAQVSNKHSGFIINKDHASANDIFNLIRFVQETVSKKFGVRLETEVHMLGNFN